MTISLEKIDEVINRTGATYQEARVALESCDGDVVEAIIFIENMKKNESKGKFSFGNGGEIINVLKDFIKKGNVTRITLEKNNKIIVDIPIIAGAIGALIFTPATVASILAALISGCDLKIIKEDGEIIDVKEYTEGKVGKVREKFAKEDFEEENINEENFYKEESFEEEAFEEEFLDKMEDEDIEK